MGKVFREKPFKGTEFTKYKPEYFVNHKGNLERSPIDKDMDEFIQSQRSTLFERMLDELSSGGMYVDDNTSMINESVRLQTDLDIMLETDRIIEQYRRENNLSEDVSRAEIYDYINNRVGKIKEDFTNKLNVKEIVEIEKEIPLEKESE